VFLLIEKNVPVFLQLRSKGVRIDIRIFCNQKLLLAVGIYKITQLKESVWRIFVWQIW